MSNLPLLAFQHHVGQLFIDPGEIEFVCSLGNGELALVEKGRWHTQNGVLPVVVKGYKPFVVGSPEDFRELLLEASKLHRLRHRNITRFLGLGCFSHGTLAEVRESMFMVEEYVGTRTLRKVVGEQMRCRFKNLYDMQTALRWAAEVAAALAALHEQQPAYIHGDVKADNAFLTDTEDLTCAEATLGDLKPHRHVYDREPSTLSQHQKHIAAAHSKPQTSLELFSLERSSMGSSTSWTSAATGGKHDAAPVAWISKRQQQLQQQEQDAVLSVFRQQQHPPQLQRSSSSGCEATGTAAGDRVPRTHSMPMPIAAKALGLSSAASLPSDWEVSGEFDVGNEASTAVGTEAASGCLISSNRSSSLPEQLGGMCGVEVARSLPITSCLSAQEMAEVSAQAPATPAGTAAAAVDVKRPSAAAAPDCEQQQDDEPDAAAEAANSSTLSSSWRRKRAATLSDSASSTNSCSGSSGAGKGAVALVSLADADLDDDNAESADHKLLQQVAAADEFDQLSKQGTATLQQATLQEAAAAASDLSLNLQDTWDCSAHGGHRRRSKSDLSSHLHLQETGTERLQAAALLATSKSAPASVYRGALQDEKVHCGSLMESGLLQDPAAAAAEGNPNCVNLGSQQFQVPASAKPKHTLAGGFLRPGGQLEQVVAPGTGADKARQQQQQQQQRTASGVRPHGWELSPSGAASPCGAVHSVVLDLFADYAEDEMPINRRHRDQYTLAPGSFVQQRITPHCPAAATVLKASVSWDAAFQSSGVANSYAAAAAQLQHTQQAQQAPERPSISKAGAPSAIEAKQHGSNSAFAALTAIDCITEETSSIATDSVMGSCPPSRESTAHGGVHYFKDVPGGSPVYYKDQEGSVDSQKGLARAARGLGLSVLLPTRSIGSSGVLSSSGSGEGLYSASPSAAAVIHSGSSNASPKMQQLQLQAALEQRLGQAGHALPKVCGSGVLDRLPESLQEAELPTAAVTATAAGPAAAAAAVPVKKVRFTMERPVGSTPSRDYGLLYTAPELLNGHRPTEKVDVFAFGVLLYELLSRSLLVSHCAAAVGQNRSRKGSSRHSGSRHGGSQHSRGKAAGYSPDSAHGSSGDLDSLPEQQLLLAYAQLVAGGYRPPFPAHFPEPVQHLISSCWAAEPHERPRMTDVLSQLQELAIDRHTVATLNSYLSGLSDLGYGGPTGPECKCGCIIS